MAGGMDAPSAAWASSVTMNKEYVLCSAKLEREDKFLAIGVQGRSPAIAAAQRRLNQPNGLAVSAQSWIRGHGPLLQRVTATPETPFGGSEPPPPKSQNPPLRPKKTNPSPNPPAPVPERHFLRARSAFRLPESARKLSDCYLQTTQ